MAQEEEVMNCDVGSKIKSHHTKIIYIFTLIAVGVGQGSELDHATQT
jgi:hypothetical protein